MWLKLTFSKLLELFCLHALEYVSGEGGDTTLTDGFKIASYIKQHCPESFTLLSNVSILYKIAFKGKSLNDEAVYKSRQYTFTVNDSTVNYMCLDFLKLQ